MSVYVYLLHLERPIGAAQSDAARAARGLPPRKRPFQPQSQHYCGKAAKLAGRLDMHLARPDARFMQVVKEQGIQFCLARVWVGEGDIEKKIKGWKNGRRLCPICQGEKEFVAWGQNGSGTTLEGSVGREDKRNVEIHTEEVL